MKFLKYVLWGNEQPGDYSRIAMPFAIREFHELN